MLSSSLAALAPALAALAHADVVALDTEGDGLHRYRARLCIVQLAGTGRATTPDAPPPPVETIALVDPLAPTLPHDDLRRALVPLLGAEGPEKVLHDASFDARLLLEHGVPLARVFDTAIAARFLGEAATGLASLASSLLGVTLSKAHQHDDWGARPLDDERLAYLADDVRHLPALAHVLRERARALDILDEVLLESAWNALDARVRPNGLDDEAPKSPAWTRIDGARELRRGPQRAALRALVAAREVIAEARDVPAFRVLPNPVLVQLAARLPREASALRSFSQLRRSPELESSLLAAVARGLDEGEVPAEELAALYPTPPPAELREARKRREKGLQAWRDAEAEQRGVSNQVVLPGHCLREIVAREPASIDELATIGGFGARRLERYGTAIVACLARASSTG